MAAVATVVPLAVALTAGAAHAAPPTAEDFAVCNREAHDAVATGSASPTTKDERRAEGERRGRPETPRAPTRDGTISGSADPQLEGMAAAGATDPAYQAAYRGCMRRRGF